MLLSWCVDSSLPKAHCGWGWSLLPPLVNFSPRSADLAMRRGGLERWRREAALHAGLGFSA